MTEVEDPPLGTPVTLDIHAMTTGTGLDTVALNPDCITTDIGVTANMNTAETIPDHSTDPPHVIGAPVHIATKETCPTENLHLTAIPLEMTEDLDIAQRDTNTNRPVDPHLHHRHHHGDMGTRGINKLPSMTHHQNTTAQMKVKAIWRMI